MLSQTAEYALRAAVFLCEEAPAPRTAKQIAKAIQVPPGYLSKVLQALCRAGLVQSQRGLGGGFRLGRPADQLSVLDIVRVVDPIRRIRTCPLDLPEHAEQLCPLHQQLDDAMATIEESFRKATIADMVSKPGGRGAVKRTFCPGRCSEACGTWDGEGRLNGRAQDEGRAPARSRKGAQSSTSRSVKRT